MFFITVDKWTMIVIIVILTHDNNRMAEMSIPPIPGVYMYTCTCTVIQTAGHFVSLAMYLFKFKLTSPTRFFIHVPYDASDRF